MKTGWSKACRALCGAGLGWCVLAAAVAAQAQAPKASAAEVTDRVAAGDAPADPGPLATDISHRLDRASVEAATRKVADWQLTVAETRFNRQWTFSTLYDGLLAAGAALDEPRYTAAVRAFAERSHWQLGSVGTQAGANDVHMGLTYLTLDPEGALTQHGESTKKALDAIVDHKDPQWRILWWWCDALYMAPPVLARMYSETHDPRYLEALNREWALTEAMLYDRSAHLMSRDVLSLVKTEKNGKKLFWARGNGWVLAGLTGILDDLPAQGPSRAHYLQMYREIMAAVARQQGADGLWRAGLLDPESYNSAEISGTAFFTYAMASGVRNGVLSRTVYLPRIARAWSGMLDHIYANGRLGLIQPVARTPGDVPASSSYVYGVGAFLLAGAEVDGLLRDAEHRTGKNSRSVPTPR